MIIVRPLHAPAQWVMKGVSGDAGKKNCKNARSRHKPTTHEDEKSAESVSWHKLVER